MHTLLPSPTDSLIETGDPSIGFQPAWVQDAAGPIDVSVCIPNWNCKEQLRACLASLQDYPQGIRHETVVVDNASTDGAAEMVAREFPEVVLIRNETNAGFAKANNQAACRARGRYLFFLNNDTIVPAFSLSKLVEFADAHPEAGLIGPRLRDADGCLQISFRRKPSLAALLHRTMLLRWTNLFKPAYEEYRRSQFEATEVRRVDVLMGAALLARRDIFNRCGGWDEDFRFGVEDVELSVRMGRTHELIYWPRVEILHYGRLGSRSNVTFVLPNLLIGYIHYFRKTGSSRAAVLAYKMFISLDAPLQMAFRYIQYACRRTFGSLKKAEKCRQTGRGLWHFLRHDFMRFWRA